MKTIIRNAALVNEGNIIVADLLIVNERIEKIAPSINLANFFLYSCFQ